MKTTANLGFLIMTNNKQKRLEIREAKDHFSISSRKMDKTSDLFPTSSFQISAYLWYEIVERNNKIIDFITFLY